MNTLNAENWRMIIGSMFANIVGFLLPTKGFITALILMFGLNIWAGMRADKVSISRCKNFSFRKFKDAVAALLLFLLIIEAVFSIMAQCGDNTEALIVVKSLTYIFLYVYAQGTFRNLIIAYPKEPAFRIIYHAIRLEFKRALPTHWRPIIERYEEQHSEDDQYTNELRLQNEL